MCIVNAFFSKILSTVLIVNLENRVEQNIQKGKVLKVLNIRLNEYDFQEVQQL